eukprot:8297671-Lingulodinium_polyedra.AAC.1
MPLPFWAYRLAVHRGRHARGGLVPRLQAAFGHGLCGPGRARVRRGPPAGVPGLVSAPRIPYAV